ncbi:hypothetical protein ACFOD0_00320 [Shewanella intestini]|uniref:PilZ domain-containing protein n=1 Tax=Shewanella intestini TaxID=2017544 RepID=A0ABS5I0V0_9GAMM|nr:MULTISPECIES: hypothetical protein [Shewanella]MBR9727015.1 hypothetical protein [Shewanella intestini]MRG35816.1 hypothetical protein [Shewanella sp. XMDDZSB0408]
MLADSNSYFSVPHQFSAYLNLWDNHTPIPSQDQLRDMQSVGLQLLTDVKAMEANCLLQLRQLDNEAKAVVDFLKLQSRKIDLVLQHILESEQQQGDPVVGVQFGGSGISVLSPAALIEGQHYQVQLFMRTELVALLCIAKVVQCKAVEQQWLCEFEFSQILDDDVEQLVKASLNVQQKMLKRRKQQNQTD